MTEQAKELQRSYQKLWRARNKEKKAEYNKRYWEKKAKQKLGVSESEVQGSDKQ
ncbi:MAG: hypothetical protein FWE21_00075 [Defluviitaleaceae bacterium]|nr:hypothetical protein [Defluviitaleaceae bacterium]